MCETMREESLGYDRDGSLFEHRTEHWQILSLPLSVHFLELCELDFIMQFPKEHKTCIYRHFFFSLKLFKFWDFSLHKAFNHEWEESYASNYLGEKKIAQLNFELVCKVVSYTVVPL